MRAMPVKLKASKSILAEDSCNRRIELRAGKELRKKAENEASLYLSSVPDREEKFREQKVRKRHRIPPRLIASLILISASMFEMLVLVENRGIFHTGQMFHSRRLVRGLGNE